MIAHKSPISGIAAYNEKYIATSGYDNQVILWSLQTNEAIECSFHDHLANSCRFSSCGNYLLTASSDYSARLWKVPEMNLLQVFSGHKDDLSMAVFSSVDDRIATSSNDSDIRIYSIDGKLLHVLTDHENTVLTVNWSKDDKTLVSSGNDGTIRIWDTEKGVLQKTFNFDGIETDTIVINDGFIYAGNDDGEVFSVNLETEEIEKIPAHQAGIKVIQLNASGNKLVSASYDYSAKVWALDKGEITLIHDIECPPAIWLRAVCWINDHQLAFGTFGTSYAVYNLNTKKWNIDNVEVTHGINDLQCEQENIYTIGDSGQLKVNGEVISDVGFLCNFVLKVEDKVLVGGLPGRIVEAVSNKVVLEYKSPLNCAVSYIDNGITHVVIGSYTGELLVFKYENDEFTRVNELKTHPNAVKSLAINNGVLFSLCANGDCVFLDLPTFRILSKTDNAHQQIANGGDALGDNSFVSVGRDKNMIIWNENYAPTYFKTPATHSVKCVASSSDGNRIACGSYNGSVSIYSRDSGEWESKRLTKNGISSIYFNDYSGDFVASSYNGNVYTL